MPDGRDIDLLFPLDRLYPSGQALPAVEALPGEEVPLPQRRLLVHRDDMTPTLAAFHGATIGLTVWQRHHDPAAQTLLREVVLFRADTGAPVEYGAIVIHLAPFSPEARAAILGERMPLGSVLAAYRVAHTSCPQAFVRVAPCPWIAERLALRGADAQATLYGRRNLLLAPDGRPLADILEILPPHPRGK